MTQGFVLEPDTLPDGNVIYHVHEVDVVTSEVTDCIGQFMTPGADDERVLLAVLKNRMAEIILERNGR